MPEKTPFEHPGLAHAHYNLAALSAFVRAAKARSFAAAGRQLGVSSSAIGKSVSRLEASLGARLFHRNTRTITLTQEGTSLLGACGRIFAEIEAVEAELAGYREAPRGTLRVGLPWFGMLPMRAMTDFMASFPDIQLDVDFTSPTVDVIKSGYDVAIQTGDWADSRLMTRTLGSYRLMLVGSPEYFARKSAPSTMEDLARHDCLHHRDPADGKLTRWPLRASEGEEWLAPPAKAVATAIRPLVAMTEAGLGLACLPDFAVESQLRNGTLVQVLGELIEHQDSFRAVWPTSRHLSPKTRAFIDFMADRLLSPPACAGLHADPG